MSAKYRITLLDEDGRVEGTQLVPARSEEAVYETASDMLVADPGSQVVEVWRGAELIFRISKIGAS